MGGGEGELMHLGFYLTLYTKQAECNEWELKSSVKSEDKANLGAKSNKSWVYTSASYLQEESKVALNVLFTAFR